MHLAQRSFDIPFALLCFIYIPLIRTLASLFISYIVQSQNPTHPHPHPHTQTPTPQPLNQGTNHSPQSFFFFGREQDNCQTQLYSTQSATGGIYIYPPIHTFLQQTLSPSPPLQNPPLLCKPHSLPYSPPPLTPLLTTPTPHPTPKSQHISISISAYDPCVLLSWWWWESCCCVWLELCVCGMWDVGCGCVGC